MLAYWFMHILGVPKSLEGKKRFEVEYVLKKRSVATNAMVSSGGFVIPVFPVQNTRNKEKLLAVRPITSRKIPLDNLLTTKNRHGHCMTCSMLSHCYYTQHLLNFSG